SPRIPLPMKAGTWPTWPAEVARCATSRCLSRGSKTFAFGRRKDPDRRRTKRRRPPRRVAERAIVMSESADVHAGCPASRKALPHDGAAEDLAQAVRAAGTAVVERLVSVARAARRRLAVAADVAAGATVRAELGVAQAAADRGGVELATVVEHRDPRFREAGAADDPRQTRVARVGAA